MRLALLGGFQIDLPRSKHYPLSIVRGMARERRVAAAVQDGGCCCVYVYCDADEQVFYIGEGSPERPHSPHDHPIFTRYVTEELGGVYSVHVLESDMSKDAAETLEQDLLEIFGTGCVNWVDAWAGRTEEDLAAEEKQCAERRAHDEIVRRLLQDIKNTQRSDQRAAIAYCRRLVELSAAWEDLEVARQRADAQRKQGYSLKAALNLKWDDFRPSHNAGVSDVLLKLTTLLLKQRDWAQIIASVDWLRERYPEQFIGYVAKREQVLMARRGRAAAELAAAKPATPL